MDANYVVYLVPKHVAYIPQRLFRVGIYLGFFNVSERQRKVFHAVEVIAPSQRACEALSRTVLPKF